MLKARGWWLEVPLDGVVLCMIVPAAVQVDGVHLLADVVVQLGGLAADLLLVGTLGCLGVGDHVPVVCRHAAWIEQQVVSERWLKLPCPCPDASTALSRHRWGAKTIARVARTLGVGQTTRLHGAALATRLAELAARQPSCSCDANTENRPAAASNPWGGTATHSLWPFSMGGRSVMASRTVTVRRGAPAGRLVSTAQ